MSKNVKKDQTMGRKVTTYIVVGVITLIFSVFAGLVAAIN